MLTFTTGNLLDAKVEALVNTVNTVGVMGKGIALMFKENFPENTKEYEAACKRGDVVVGKMLVTHGQRLGGPKFIINFPTKKHWRNPSKLEWISDGLDDLVRVIRELHITSIAVPPLGAGNGGLNWSDVKEIITHQLGHLNDVNVIIFEPTSRYQNVQKKTGKEELTPARAMVAELVRRYEVLGLGCTILEVQKLAYLLERAMTQLGLSDTLDLRFKANKFGPFAPRLNHLLNSLDGSYLHCDKRLADAGPLDSIQFDGKHKDRIGTYLQSASCEEFRVALDHTSALIDGFESPLGMELLATVDWLVNRGEAEPTVEGVRAGLANWLGGGSSAERKERLFDEHLIGLALQQLSHSPLFAKPPPSD